jgi:transmembrane sensor
MRDEHGDDRAEELSSDLTGELARLVTRYVVGECSPDEAARVEAYLAGAPAAAEHVRRLRKVWDATDRPRTHRDVDRAWETLRAQLGPDVDVDAPAFTPSLRVVRAEGAPTPTSPIPRQPRARPRTRFLVRLVAAAAAVLAIAVPATLVRRAVRSSPRSERVATAPAVHEYATRAGQRAELTLGDGTRIILGAASRLHVPLAYGDGAREVALDGEAYFDVVHDPALPFRVRTPLGVAEDIGTVFVVSTHPEAGGMRVVVATGAVALTRVARSGLSTPVTQSTPPAPEPLQRLESGDLGRLDTAGIVHVTHGVDVPASLAWTRGELVFHQLPLRDAVPQLERWYGIHVRIADSALGAAPISASFADETAPQALTLIATAVNARLLGDDTTFVLSRR